MPLLLHPSACRVLAFSLTCPIYAVMRATVPMVDPEHFNPYWLLLSTFFFPLAFLFYIGEDVSVGWAGGGRGGGLGGAYGEAVSVGCTGGGDPPLWPHVFLRMYVPVYSRAVPHAPAVQ